MATHSGKTVKIDVVTTETGDVESEVYRLSSKEAACALYRSITEHHAFYRCDSVRPAVKQQVARDLRFEIFDTFLSWFHHDDNSSEQNYIFDTERTCREAYDHARRILYNFGTSTVAAMTVQKGLKNMDGTPICDEEDSTEEVLQQKVLQLTEQLDMFKDSFNCMVCRDSIVDVVLQCGHSICSSCSKLCDSCPLCRAVISNKTKFYLPVNITCINSDQQISQTDLRQFGDEAEMSDLHTNVLDTAHHMLLT